MSAPITYGTIFEDQSYTAVNRIEGNNASNIVQADITAITCNVYDMDSSTPDTSLATPTVTVSSAVFNTLQTDGYWKKDSTGYNFRHTVPASAFATPNHRYWVEYTFDPASGDNFSVIHVVSVVGVKAS